MGYRVTKDGEIICDTPEEAIALAHAIGGTEGRQERKPGPVDATSRWTEPRYKDFMASIRGRHQMSFLDLLLDAPHGQTDEKIRQALHLKSNNALAGVTAGISKNARKVGIDVSQVYTKERLMVGNERISEYKLTDAFRSIAQQMKKGKLG